jgi:SAM-dependent methyltransferase
MHLGLIPDSPAEWKALASGRVALPFLETHFCFGLAQAVMVATKLGMFESLASQTATATEVARRCETDPVSTRKLLNALVASGYLCNRGDRYALTANARTWLLAGSPRSLVDAVLFSEDQWDFVAQIEDYVRAGMPLDIHERMTDEQWDRYQRCMRALAGQLADEVAQVLPVPCGATDMVDVGGSHGHFSVALCRRHHGLRSVVLDLPEAVRAAAPLLAADNMGRRVVHLESDALTHDFGVDTYDVVLLSNLAHHFDASQNAELFARLGRALRPRGLLAVLEPIQPQTGEVADQLAALNELYFGVTSRAGVWTVPDIAGWQRGAGLQPAAQPIMLSDGGTGLQIATKR